jgi:hypothetical protein
MQNVKNFASKNLTEKVSGGKSKPDQSIEIYVRIEGRNDQSLQVSVGAKRRFLPFISRWFGKVWAAIQGAPQS